MSTVIFLDIDGVLVNRKSLRESSGLYAKVDPACVAALNRIIDATGAKIVVSSTWRLGMTIPELSTLLKSWGVTGEVIGSTPTIDNVVNGRYSSASRTLEIGAWLKSHPWDDFIVLDDTDSEIAYKSRLIHTKFETGLTEEDADKAIEILNQHFVTPGRVLVE